MKKITLLTLVPVFAAVIVISQSANAGKSAQAPTQKQVLSAMMKNLDVNLKDASHCQGVGLELSDKTIGDYLSGFWAFHANMQGKNWLDISTTPTNKGHLAKVMLYRKDGEENWGWGVSFEMDNSGKVNRKSFTCLGGG